MDDTLLFIPPCCIDNKLPRAIYQAPRCALTFYTHGDVTMEKFHRAVAYMIGGSHMMVLAMPILEPETMAFFLQCLERNWVTSIVLLSNRDQRRMVEKYLAGYEERYFYTFSKDVTELSSHMALYNEDRSLTINGPMYARSFNNICLVSYSAMFHPSYNLNSRKDDWGIPLRNLLMPDVLAARKDKEQTRREHTTDIDHFLHLEFPPFNE